MSNTPEIEVVTTTLAEFDKVGAGIAALQSLYAGVVYPVETVKGMKDAVAARAALRAPRVQIEKLRKDAKAPLLEIGRKLDAEAKRITAEIVALEDPIDAVIKAEEARKEAEKAAKVAAELARMERISAAVAEIANIPGKLARAGSKEVADARDALESRGLLTTEFEERLTEALNLKASVLAELDTMHDAAVAHEAEQARIVAERAELERLRLAEVQRQKDEAARLVAESARLEAQRQQQEADNQRAREALAEAERLAKAERDAEQARIEAQRRAEDDAREQAAADARAAQAAADAAAKAARDAEEARIAAAHKALADQQAEFTRQQAQASADKLAEEQRAAAQVAEAEEAARVAAMPSPVPSPVGEESHDNVLPFDAQRGKPDAEQFVDVIATEFGVPLELALDWLRTTDFNDQALPLALAA